jgi:hypothetical protein
MPGVAPTTNPTNATAASGGNGSITYEWRRSGTSSATLTSSNSSGYTISSDATNYSTAGTYYFNRYAKDGACNTTFTASNGTYTLTVARSTPPSAGTNTYTCGTQTWSEPIKIAACDKPSFTNSVGVPECRSYTWNGIKYFYYNWSYMNTNQSTMCPTPWRVPTMDDVNYLLSCHGATNQSGIYVPENSAWGGAMAGVANGSIIECAGACANYWSATIQTSEYGYVLYISTGAVWLSESTFRYAGAQVRCVN